MNNHASTAQKQMSVGTLVVVMILVSIALAAAAYFMMHDVIPAIQNFQDQLQAVQPKNQK